MFVFVKKIFSLLDRQERRQFFWLMFAIVIVGLIDVAGVASIMPFMAVVSSPEIVENNHYLFWCYQALGFTSVNSFLVFLGFLVFFVLLLSNTVKALVLFLELRFVHLRLYSLSRRLLFRYLARSYTFFLNQNTSVLGKNILQEVSKFTHEVLRPCTQILTRIVSILFVLGLLIVVDPLLAMMIMSVLGGAYILLYCLVQKKLARLGKERFEANAMRFKSAGEAFGGVKELKVLKRQRYFFDQFSGYAYRIERNMAINGLVSNLPSYIMEVMAFGGILIIVLYFLAIRQGVGNTLPVISLYAFAGYRLLPALQGVFSAMSTLRFNVAILDALHRDLAGMTDGAVSWRSEEVDALPFQRSIAFSGVTFGYPGSGTPVVRDLNLTIMKNSSVGLVGATGAGKTTVVDLLLGLLVPDEGALLVDDTPLDEERLSRWQRMVGYVPQVIFLSDDSLMNNIAFGVPPEKIDREAVERAARIANIHQFVMESLPEGYETHVGEKGVRLSGGQRQRIGIARALYHDPAVLIMDEATSALDGITEEAIIQAIHDLAGKKTIVTIAHRLTTLRECDVIYVMEQGRVVEQGTYDQLSGSSVRFQAMARTGTR